MRLLLDTHALLWWLGDLPQLGPNARRLIMHPDHVVFVSAVSAWEVEIKRALGKLVAPNDLADAIGACGFEALVVTVEHGIVAGRLPAHHNDPFDRMLIAQATIQELTILTRDSAFAAYDVALVPADR